MRSLTSERFKLTHHPEPVRWSVFERSGECRLAIGAGDAGLREIRFDGTPPAGAEAGDNATLRAAREQLHLYFAGQLREFTLPLDLRGTEFQQRVWQQLRRIPWGQTRSYSQIAAAIGHPKAVRAVGAANGRNPVPIVVPCHRVIGASGKLVGFGGGLAMKRLLLALEQPAQGFFS